MHGWTLPGVIQIGAVNLLGEPSGPSQLSHGRFIDSYTGTTMDADIRAGIQDRLSRLSKRVTSESEVFWPDSLPARADSRALNPGDNPHIPSGYTYLLQLMAHDMVDSGVAAATPGTVPMNGRTRPLMLDTIYGMGPDASPCAYDSELAGDVYQNEPGRLPRRYLRTAQPKGKTLPNPRTACPFQDIARSGVSRSDGSTLLTEALVSDPRNDAHALMSQTAVLFHLAHNAIYKMIAKATGNDRSTDVEFAYRLFACSRAILTLIYRRIVRFDVLPRILHPDVMALYGKTCIPLSPFNGVPVEFSRGAFRFAHAMVRSDYQFNANSHKGPDNKSFVELSSRREPENMPLAAEWMVDWAFFFDLRDKIAGAPAPNLSRRLGPRYPNALDIDAVFLAKSDHDGTGLSYRDYKSTISAGQWKVSALMARLKLILKEKGTGPARLLPDFAITWQPLIKSWLAKNDVLSGEDCALLSEDPPWPFFVLFESAFKTSTSTPTCTGMGQHLGPMGSLVTAETIIGALAANPVVKDEWGSLKNAIREACRVHLDRTDIVPELTGDSAQLPEDMASFLVFLARENALQPQP
jgi:Animal haem peroxidase